MNAHRRHWHCHACFYGTLDTVQAPEWSNYWSNLRKISNYFLACQLRPGEVFNEKKKSSVNSAFRYPRLYMSWFWRLSTWFVLSLIILLFEKYYFCRRISHRRTTFDFEKVYKFEAKFENISDCESGDQVNCWLINCTQVLSNVHLTAAYFTGTFIVWIPTNSLGYFLGPCFLSMELFQDLS